MILFLIFRPLKKIIFASGRIIFVTTKTSLSAGVVITEKSLSITDWADLKYAWIIILVGSTFAGAAVSYGLVGPLGFLIGGLCGTAASCINFLYITGGENPIQGPGRLTLAGTVLLVAGMVVGIWLSMA